MRAAFVIFLALALGRIASADALLSVSATAGTQTCQQAAAPSASCSVTSTIYVPAGQFYSPASASASLSFDQQNYFLQGNWSMGQGVGLNDQVNASLAASIDLPSDSGNWVFSGSIYDATDDQGGAVGPIEIVTTDGSGWISGSSPSVFTILHSPGTPLSISIQVSDFVAEAQSSNNLDFELRMLDPVAVPEPPTCSLALLAVLVGQTIVLWGRRSPCGADDRLFVVCLDQSCQLLP